MAKLNKEVVSDVQLNPFLQKRWSPRAFLPTKVEKDVLKRIFEAGRWAPSSFNEQPWRFIIGVKGEGKTWDKLYSSLVEFNQHWNTNVPVLVLIVAKKIFTKFPDPNRHYMYDTGQAAAHVTVQTMAEGLYCHQMGGFSIEKARELFHIPQDYEPCAMMAIGYLGDPATLPADLQKSEAEPRSRLPLSSIAFEEDWERKFPF